VLDSFRTGNYGVAACEGLAAGRIVVAHISEEVRRRTRELTGEELPIVEATPESLAEVLLGIVEDPTRALGIAAAGPEFVRRFHGGSRSGAVLAEWLDQHTSRTQ
jgi:glycosyltransferase involved in cell wall biosynthesis